MPPLAPSALLEAIRAGDAAAVAALLADTPTETAGTGPGGESLVLYACYAGHPALVPLLAGTRPLDTWEAGAIGDRAALQRALHADPGSLYRLSPDGWTPLHLAAFFGQDPCVALLLAQGTSCDTRSGNAMANTALHAALAGVSALAVVLRLVESGADVDARAAGGVTPLHVAASRGQRPVVDLLLAHGADPDVRDDQGRTPARLAAERGHDALAHALGNG